LDRVNFSDRKPGRAWNRTAANVENRIVVLRTSLREESVLGEYGAGAIKTALEAEIPDAPSQAAINRVLSRRGLQDRVRRIRRPAPPKGWYLPEVAAGRAEVDCFDFIEDLKIANGPLVNVLTAKSLHAALTNAPPRLPMLKNFELNLDAPLQGQMIFIRRTNESGHAHLLGRRFAISPAWPHRLVRCEVDFDHHRIRCFALRRRAPTEQPLLATIDYHRPNKPFYGQP
jgi:hypothetical protein